MCYFQGKKLFQELSVSMYPNYWLSVQRNAELMLKQYQHILIHSGNTNNTSIAKLLVWTEDVCFFFKKKRRWLRELMIYLLCERYGAPPHGGFGVGLERVVMLFCALNNIRKTSLFPRDPQRIAPWLPCRWLTDSQNQISLPAFPIPFLSWIFVLNSLPSPPLPYSKVDILINFHHKIYLSLRVLVFNQNCVQHNLNAYAIVNIEHDRQTVWIYLATLHVHT